MPLPECHSRHELREGSRTFFCSHPKMHSRDHLVTSAVCRVCELWKEPPPENPRPVVPPPAQQATGQCFFLGECTGERECPSCRGRVRVKTFACRHPYHDDVTLKECQHCGDFDPLLKQGEVGTWAIGIVGSDRQQVRACQERLRGAGWEDASILTDAVCAGRCKGTLNQSNGKPDEEAPYWPGWFVMLSRLLAEEATADTYVTVPAEFQAGEGLRAALEKGLWPEETKGVVAIDTLDGIDGEAAISESLSSASCAQFPPAARSYVMASAAARSLCGFAAATNHRRWARYQHILKAGQTVADWQRAGRLESF
jgi:hypothetical protein